MQHISLNALCDAHDFDRLTFFDLPQFNIIVNLTGRIFKWMHRWKKKILCFEQEIVCIKQSVVARLFNIVIQ